MRPTGNRWHGRASGPLLARSCGKCHRFLQADDFYNNPGGVCGKNPYCKPCVVKSTTANSVARGAVRAEAGLRKQRSHQHGMSDEEYLSFIARDACDACGATDPGWDRGWHIDHDHSCCPTPKSRCGNCVRGLLCHHCNVTLGMVQDKREHLMALVAYLDNRLLQNDDPSKSIPGVATNGG